MAGRAVYANVCDYQYLTNVGATDQAGFAIASLAAYTVKVNIDTTAAALGALGAGAVVRIDVTVTHSNLQVPMVLSGYRTKY